MTVGNPELNQAGIYPLAALAKNPRIESLDGFRGVAALAVLFWHHYIMMLDTGFRPLAIIYSYGFLSRSGVDMFFVLSGFLIFGILFDQRESNSYFKPFYIRRCFRILPLYIILLFIYFVCLFINPIPWVARGLVPAWTYCLMIQNYYIPRVMSYGAPLLSATWSIAVEEHFYIVFPLIIRFATGVRLPLIFLSVGLISVVARLILAQKGAAGTFSCYTWSICRFDSLMLGALLGWLVRNKPVTVAAVNRQIGRYWFLLLLLVPLAGPLIVRNMDFYMAEWGYEGCAIIYAVLLLQALDPLSVVSRIMTNRFLRYTGRISYGLYLFQGSVIFLFREVFGSSDRIRAPADLILPTCALFATFIASDISYRFFEAPLVRVGRRLGCYIG